MENNCLVTKLKAEINNIDLFALDELLLVQDLNATPDEEARSIEYYVNVGPVVLSSHQNNTTAKTITNVNIPLPYTINSGGGGNTIFNNPTSDKCYISFKNKKKLTELTIKYCDIVSDTFESFKYYNDLQRLCIRFSSCKGSMLSAASIVSLNRFCIDAPTAEIKDSNVRQFVNTFAANKIATNNLTAVAMAFRNYGDTTFLSNIPVGFNGSYWSNYATVYFTTDTTTYPNGWYVKATNNKYYNSLDQEIEAPA